MGTALVQLYLRPLSLIESGEAVHPLALPMSTTCIVGRSAEADWAIPFPSISRRHASIARKGDGWFITDLSSRHGTSVNDRRLEPGSPVPLRDGDTVAFGAWRCRCTSGSARVGVTTSYEPAALANAVSVSVIPAQQLSGVAQRGLNVLMDFTERLADATSRTHVAEATVEAVREATGCRRVVLVETESETDLAVLASTTADAPRISRTLIEQASRHGLVQLMVDAGLSNHAQSIMDLGIRSAICAPVLVDDAPTAYIMIDTRDAEGVVPHDAAAFCQSVARLTGLAFQRISAALMTERHRQLQADLDAARRAQELLSPPRQGRFGAMSYRFESIPGRIVAGDLFDVFPLGDQRAAFFLGDVSGKGVGAAMLMAACQSQLRTQLLSGAGLPSAMAAVNADLHQRTEASKFVTLIAGILDASSRTLTIADAGHGLLLRLDASRAHRITPEPGFPLGVVAAAEYPALQIDVAEGDALMMFSDGAVEQQNAEGHQFGTEGVLAALDAIESPDRAVPSLLDAVKRHAAGPLADDLTAACIWLP